MFSGANRSQPVGSFWSNSDFTSSGISASLGRPFATSIGVPLHPIVATAAQRIARRMKKLRWSWQRHPCHYAFTPSSIPASAVGGPVSEPGNYSSAHAVHHECGHQAPIASTNRFANRPGRPWPESYRHGPTPPAACQCGSSDISHHRPTIQTPFDPPWGPTYHIQRTFPTKANVQAHQSPPTPSATPSSKPNPLRKSQQNLLC